MNSPPNSNGDVENIPDASPTPITTNSGRGSGTKLPRLVTRNRIFSQSSNKVRVQHQYDRRIIWLLLKYDWFHFFLRCSIGQAMATLLGVWTGMILMFAAIYKAIDDNHPDRNCGLAVPSETISYHSAFAFSLETCTTVGYGLPNGTNSFFEECTGLVCAIYGQMVWSMLFNAFLTAFLFSRMSRSDARGSQVIFAEKAVVSLVSGRMQLQIRCYDADAKLPVVEAHVRLYCVSKDRPVPRPLRVLSPNDEIGAALFLSFPTVISHHIDAYSQLHPPVTVHNHTTATVHPAGLDLRQVDSLIASREEIICPVCGESYGTHERWQRHVRYQQMVERKDDYPVETSHLALEESDLKPPVVTTLAELRKHFAHNLSEIIVVVEGIDPLLSGTFQALHSYQFDDLVWHEYAVYSPCMQVRRDYVEVDLDEFHKVNIPATASKRRLTSHDFLVDHDHEDEKRGHENESNHIFDVVVGPPVSILSDESNNNSNGGNTGRVIQSLGENGQS